MAILERDAKILWGRAAARCAFPDCRKELVAERSAEDREVVIGEMAHIVAASKSDARGDSPLTEQERNRYTNLILLCRTHHKLIDGQPKKFSVGYLHQLKADHEEWVATNLGDERARLMPETSDTEETLYGSLLPVETMPRYVYSAKCSLQGLKEKDLRKHIIWENVGRGHAAVAIRRGDRLYAFHDLRSTDSPFAKVADPYTGTRHDSREWWDDPDRARWFADLLRRCLNKLTGRRGLNLDREHKRYYFEPDVAGAAKSVTYRPLNMQESTLNVVWQPVTRATGEPKKHWEHRAVGLRFHRVEKGQWCLSIRPERRFTRDGFELVARRTVGQRSTRQRCRMYNHELLSELNFWRDFLSDGAPRIILKFGRQTLIIATRLLESTVLWPGVPGDAQPFRNVGYEDDLFTWADYKRALDDAEGADNPEEFEEDDDLGGHDGE